MQTSPEDAQQIQASGGKNEGVSMCICKKIADKLGYGFRYK